MSEEKSPQPEAEVAEVTSPSPNPNAGNSGTPSEAIENAPSSDEAVASDFPTANAPDPKAVNQDVNPNAAGEKPTTDTAAGDTNPQTDAKAKAKSAKPTGDKPPAKAKKEKAPTVEDKPFPEFIEQEYLPALKTAFAKEGISDVEVTFVKDKIKIPGLSKGDACWQVAGKWKDGQRQFNIYFPEEDINKPKAFSLATNGAKTSTLESFMIDERKVTLDLIVFYTMQRLNAEKWLAWN